MSERGLHKAFRLYMNKSVADELEQTRIRHSQQLLLDTDKKILAVASESGFGDPRNLFYTFQRTFGIGPKAWQEQHK